MTIGTLLVLGAFIFYVLKKGKHAKDGKPSQASRLKTVKTKGGKQLELLPTIEKFEIGQQEWWPSNIIGKQIHYFEKVKFRSLFAVEPDFSIGSAIELSEEYPPGWVHPWTVYYRDSFQAQDRDGNYLNDFKIGRSGKWKKAFDDNRLHCVVHDIDKEEKEIACTVVIWDKPLPWKSKGDYHIPEKSFNLLVEKANDTDELNALLVEWWSKRDARAAKRAAKKAQE